MKSRPPVMRSRNPSPRTGPCLIMKTALPAPSPVTPPKAPNIPLASVGMPPEVEYPNEATGSSVGANGQYSSFSVGVSAAVNEIKGPRSCNPEGGHGH